MPDEDTRTVVRKASEVSYGDKLDETLVAEGTKAAEAAAQANELRRAVLRPLSDLIERDPDAKAAFEKLRNLDLDPRTATLMRPADLQNSGLSFSDLSNLNSGLNFFSPPYDHQRVGKRSGFQLGQDTADQFAGNLHTDGWGGDADGFLFASVGLGIDLVTNSNGHLDFRPLVQTDWYGRAFGDNLSSHIEGHIVTTAFDDGGNVVVTPTDFTLFSFDNDNDASDAPTLSAPWVSINFPVLANRTYQVWIEAVLRGDQSGDYLFGWSHAGGRIDARVPFIVAELR